MKPGLVDALVIVLAAALVTAAAFRAAYDFDHYYGVDYYHFWGIPAAHDVVGANPYSRTSDYAQALNRISDASKDSHLRWANQFRREIQPTATPFFYAACALLPRAFDVGYATWIAMLFVALVGAVYGMARMQEARSWPALAIAAGIALTFAPFDDDVKAGNVNAFQLAFLVAAIAIAKYRIDARRVIFSLAYFAALAFFVMAKPNTALVAGMLGLHFFMSRDLRPSMLATVAGVAAIAAAFAIGAGYFDGLHAWSDWSAYVNGHGGTLLYRTEDGNLSLAMLMSQRTGGLGPLAYGVLLGVAFLAFLAAALTAYGKHMEGFAQRARILMADPWFAASVGVLVTLAAAPLVWPHYLVLALIPAAWTWGSHRGWDRPRAFLVVGYALLVLPLAFGPVASAAKTSIFMLGWLPIAAAMVARVAGQAPSR